MSVDLISAICYYLFGSRGLRSISTNRQRVPSRVSLGDTDTWWVMVCWWSAAACFQSRWVALGVAIKWFIFWFPQDVHKIETETGTERVTNGKGYTRLGCWPTTGVYAILKYRSKSACVWLQMREREIIINSSVKIKPYRFVVCYQMKCVCRSVCNFIANQMDWRLPYLYLGLCVVWFIANWSQEATR